MPDDVHVPQIDLWTVLFAGVGLGLAVSLAVLAGIASARVFFKAARDAEEKRA